MSTSIDPVSPEHDEIVYRVSAQADTVAVVKEETPLDLYAESELRLRHERTERMIRMAQEHS